MSISETRDLSRDCRGPVVPILSLVSKLVYRISVQEPNPQPFLGHRCHETNRRRGTRSVIKQESLSRESTLVEQKTLVLF